MTLADTSDILGGPRQDADYVISIAENLGWTVVRLDGVAKPDLLLLRDNIVPVFIRSKLVTDPRRRAFSQFSLAGARSYLWGRADGTEILRVLG